MQTYGKVGGSGLPRALVGVLFGITALHVATVWGELPELVASHFDAGGRPNGFMPRGGFFVTIALVGGGTILTTLFTPALLRYVPTQLINVPNRDYWFAPERRESAIASLETILSWMAVQVAVLLALVIELTIRANLGRGRLDMSVFTVLFGLFMASTPITLVLVFRRFRLPQSA
jgi:uncharacterized membrane protein